MSSAVKVPIWATLEEEIKLFCKDSCKLDLQLSEKKKKKHLKKWSF